MSMIYHMRRNERQIEDWLILEDILQHGKYAAIALCRQDEPYIVTLSYGYDKVNRTLYFHCSKDGLKNEFARQNPHACITVIDDKGYIKNECSHAYRSVVMRGRIEILDEHSEKLQGLDVLIGHLEENPELIKAGLPRKQHLLEGMNIWKFKIDEITGKEGR
jgi:uncharacterized protein